MRKCQVLSRDWKEDLASLVTGAGSRLTISSPYVTKEGIAFLLGALGANARGLDGLSFLTDLSPGNICDGATDPMALASLVSAIPRVTVRHLPRLHAKVYISDATCAIVTSGNLTAGGLHNNYEYGVKILDEMIVSRMLQDISSYSELGAPIGPERLAVYCDVVDRMQAVSQTRRDSVRRSVRLAFQRAVAEAELQLLRFRLAEGAMHTVFAKTILYLLAKYGPLSTQQLHPKIQAIHPDLCDDNVDRIIDGRHFGKRWKHAVRSAQQQLKRRGLVILSDGQWYLT